MKETHWPCMYEWRGWGLNMILQAPLPITHTMLAHASMAWSTSSPAWSAPQTGDAPCPALACMNLLQESYARVYQHHRQNNHHPRTQSSHHLSFGLSTHNFSYHHIWAVSQFLYYASDSTKWFHFISTISPILFLGVAISNRDIVKIKTLAMSKRPQ